MESLQKLRLDPDQMIELAAEANRLTEQLHRALDTHPSQRTPLDHALITAAPAMRATATRISEIIEGYIAATRVCTWSLPYECVLLSQLNSNQDTITEHRRGVIAAVADRFTNPGSTAEVVVRYTPDL